MDIIIKEDSYQTLNKETVQLVINASVYWAGLKFPTHLLIKSNIKVYTHNLEISQQFVKTETGSVLNTGRRQKAR